MLTKKDKIAITGGTGFLGSHILRGLLEQGYSNIYALRRKTSQMDLVRDIADRINWIEGDILDITSLELLTNNCVGVIHSAAKVSYHPKDKDDVLTTNVEGTANVVNVSVANGVKKLIFISSVAAIGRTKPGQSIDEKSEWIEDKNTTTYGLSKHLSELEIWRGKVEGLQVGILNPSMVLGPSYWGDSSTKLFSYVMRGGKFYPPGSNGFVDVRDLAVLTIKYLASEIKSERIIVVSEMSSYKNLLNKIAEGLNKKAPSTPLKKWAANLVWRLMSFTSDPAITRETVAITSQDYIYDNSRSLQLFDFEYRDIDASVRDTCEKYLKSKSHQRSYAYFERIHS